jgi:hypothetical protein
MSINCLKTLTNSIKEIEQTIKHKDSEKFIFKASKEGLFDRSKAPKHLKTEIENAFASVAPERDIIGSALLVTAWGAFESFIRDLFIYAADQINLKAHVTNLSKTLKSQHIIYSCNAIMGSASGDAKYPECIYVNATESLHSVIKDSPDAKLHSPIYGIINFKFDAEKLLKSFHRLDLKISWNDIGSNDDIKKHFTETTKTAAGNKAKKHFEEVYKMRCNFAHNGGLSYSPSENQDTQRAIEFLGYLGSALVDVVDAEVTRISKVSKKS